MVLVDPKRLELNLYENIPHLIAPVVTDPKIASNVLRNATREMENRLKLLAQRGVRNIDQYNRTFKKEQSLSLFDNVEEPEHKPLPYLIIVIDELADLMMVDTNNVEESITRLAQMARAVGIHLILATQRPTVDVRSEEHTSELQSQSNLVCRLLLEKKKKKIQLHNLTNLTKP